MPVTKNALLRYGILDEALSNGARNRDFALTKRELLEKVNAALVSHEVSPCSMRSIEKDLFDMQNEYGVSIEYFAVNRIRHYHYRDPYMSINKSGLDPSVRAEVERVLDLLESKSITPGMGIADEFVPIVRSTLGLREGRPGGTRNVILSDNEYYAGRRWIESLADAIRLGRVLDVQYQSFKDAMPMVWRVHPHALKQFNGRWFCVVYQPHYVPNPEFEGEDSKWRRVLALDRIRSIRRVSQEQLEKEAPLDREYRPDREWDGQWDDYFSEVIGPTVPRDRLPEEVVIRFAQERAPYVWTKPIHGSQKPRPDQPLPEPHKGAIEFRYRLIPNPEFYSAVLAFGPDAEVVKPASIRQELQNRIENMVRLYRDA